MGPEGRVEPISNKCSMRYSLPFRVIRNSIRALKDAERQLAIGPNRNGDEDHR